MGECECSTVRRRWTFSVVNKAKKLAAENFELTLNNEEMSKKDEGKELLTSQQKKQIRAQSEPPSPSGRLDQTTTKPREDKTKVDWKSQLAGDIFRHILAVINFQSKGTSGVIFVAFLATLAVGMMYGWMPTIFTDIQEIKQSNQAVLKGIQELEQKIMKRLDNGLGGVTPTGQCPVFSGHQPIESGNGEGHTVEAAEEKSSKSLSCIIRDAPSQVVGVKDLLIERLKKALLEENYTLADDPDGPAVAFVANGSRLESDLKRDLKNVPAKSRTILVVFKPTMDPWEKPEKVNPASHGFPWVEEAVLILVNIDNTELHACDTNTEAVNALIRFLK